MEFQKLVLDLTLSDNTTLDELKEIYTIIKYIPWNEKELNEIKRVHTIIRTKHTSYYDPNSFQEEVLKYHKDFPIPKIMKKIKNKFEK